MSQVQSEAVENEDETGFWIKDKKQHHITCTWSNPAHGCLSEAQEGLPCPHLRIESNVQADPRFSVSPKISGQAGQHPKGKIPKYDRIAGLDKVKDVGDMKNLQSIDALLEDAQNQHEDLAEEVSKACAGPLCPGIYS